MRYYEASRYFENTLTLSDDQVNVIKKYDSIFNPGKDTQIGLDDILNTMNSDQFKSEMGAAARTSRYQNDYKHNDYDKSRVVDVMNLTHDQKVELAQFAADLINQVRAQVGSKPITVSDTMIEAADKIAAGYTADHRISSDGKRHDVPVITSVMSQYGFSDSANYYEDMTNWFLGYDANVNKENLGFKPLDWPEYSKYHDNDLKFNGNFNVTMDYLKHNIYSNTRGAS